MNDNYVKFFEFRLSMLEALVLNSPELLKNYIDSFRASMSILDNSDADPLLKELFLKYLSQLEDLQKKQKS